MSKKKWVCMALVFAALVCGMTFVGCDNGMDTSSGTVVVNNTSQSIEYWVKTSENGSADLVEPQRTQRYSVSLGSVEEGDCTVYYCRRLEDESSGLALDDRIWYYKSCRVILDKTTNVYIP